ncbi:MAG: rRNA pseudouridine synthase [Desulfarculus sp.]|nr:MAG: rRNA pseudouridine synthase [Desulfarculus sp.]
MAQERLQKILARAGLASRRAAEEMIQAGRVAVDGQVVSELGAKADPQQQVITLDGRPLPRREGLEYWLVHKPAGVICTVDDPQGRTKVVDLLPPEVKSRLYPVGRLDLNSEGLVLLTNDGELAHQLMHPRHQVAKRYLVWVEGRPSAAALERLRSGVELDGQATAPARVGLKGGGHQGSKLSFVLLEGRKREIRLMCRAVGHPVRRLLRVGLGPLRLGEMPAGAARPLTRAEVQALREAATPRTGCKPGAHGVKKSRRTGASRRGQKK